MRGMAIPPEVRARFAVAAAGDEVAEQAGRP